MKTSFLPLLCLLAAFTFVGCQEDTIQSTNSIERNVGLDQAKHDILKTMMVHEENTISSRVALSYVATLENGSFNYSHASVNDWDYPNRHLHDYYRFYALNGSSVNVTVTRISCAMDPGFRLNTGLYTDTDNVPVGTFVDDVLNDACNSCFSEPSYTFNVPASGWYTVGVFDVLSCGAAPFQYTVTVSGVSDIINIGECTTSVPNGQHNPTTTMQQAIDNCLAGAANSAQFVSCVTSLTNTWVSQGKITRAQKSSIVTCAQNYPF